MLNHGWCALNPIAVLAVDRSGPLCTNMHFGIGYKEHESANTPTACEKAPRRRFGASGGISTLPQGSKRSTGLF